MTQPVQSPDGGDSDAGSVQPPERPTPAGAQAPTEAGRYSEPEPGVSGQGGTGAPAGESGAGAGAGGMGGSGSAAVGGDVAPPEPPLPREPLGPNEKSLVPETADVDALQRLADFQRLPVLATGSYQQQSSHDRGRPLSTAEQSFLTVALHGNRDFNNFLCKSRDARTSATVIAYQYDMASCPDSYVRGAMLARFEGSGRMVRFWLTADRFATEGTTGDEMLRIYVDDNPRAAIQVRVDELLTGGAGEIFTLPYGAASRALAAWYYPVVFNRKLIVMLDNLSSMYYYQVDAVLDSPAQPRIAPRQRLGLRDEVHQVLVRESPVPQSASSLHSQVFNLAAGTEHTLSLTGPATIQELRLRVPKAQLASLAGVRIEARWDGASEPALQLPLLDLFVASHAVVANSSLALASSSDDADQIIALRIPMPFNTRADWKLSNGGSSTAAFSLEWIGEARVPAAAFGRLHVQFRAAQLPTEQLEQTVAEATGRGRLVGICAALGGHYDRTLSSSSPTHLDLMQGDFRATVDGKQALDGTGTEDYGDSAFYFQNAPRATPFAQSWGRVSDSRAQPPGQINFCRWHILGTEIDFQRELKVIRELAQHDPSIVERHRTLAFLYLE